MIIELSRNEKLQNYRIILSIRLQFQHTTYLNKYWSTFWQCLLLPCLFFFCEIPKYVLSKHLWWAGPPGLAFYGSGLACLLSWLDMINAGWLSSMQSEFCCKWNLSFFKAVPPSRLLFYLGIPLHIISSLFSHYCLFQNAILHEMLMLEFWNFIPIFLKMQFSLIATFFFSSFDYLLEFVFAS